MRLSAALLCSLFCVMLCGAVASADEVRVTKTHLCCNRCVKDATEALRGVEGVAGVACNRQAKSIAFVADDERAAQAGVAALARAGYHGEATYAGQALAFPPSGAKPDQKADRIVLTGLHLCCGACEKAVETALDEAKLAGVAGRTCDREKGAVTVQGAAFDVSTVVAALNKAGFHGTLQKRRKSKFNRVVAVGDEAPAWKGLIGIDGERHSLREYRDAKAVVVAFISNHCPVATAYEQRLVQFTSDYRDKGVRVVAINVSNLASDRLEPMKARAAKSGFNFPYLYDPSQQIGRQFGALATPQVFVLDGQRRITYMGAIDDNQNPARVTKAYLSDAVEAVLAGREPEVTETRQFGCAIEYE
jgi:peroxiredoxin/copper chaperone CopZ